MPVEGLLLVVHREHGQVGELGLEVVRTLHILVPARVERRHEPAREQRLPVRRGEERVVLDLLRAVRARIAPEPAQELELHTPDGVCLARDTPLAEALMPGYVFFVSKV